VLEEEAVGAADATHGLKEKSSGVQHQPEVALAHATGQAKSTIFIKSHVYDTLASIVSDRDGRTRAQSTVYNTLGCIRALI
jgi:hypothetical protein